MALEDGLIIAYLLDNENDFFGNLNLTENGDVVFTAGKVGNAAKFGSGNYLDISHDNQFSLDVDKTISFWWYCDDDSSIQAFLGMWHASVSDEEWQVYFGYPGTVGAGNIGLAFTDATNLYALSSVTPFVAGNWYHILFTNDGDELVLWVNNNQENTFNLGLIDEVQHLSFGGASLGTFDVNGPNGFGTVNVLTDDNAISIQSVIDAAFGTSNAVVTGNTGEYNITFSGQPGQNITEGTVSNNSTDGSPIITTTTQGRGTVVINSGTATDFRVGTDQAGNTVTGNGLMDSVLIWDRVLNNTEIGQVYNSGNGWEPTAPAVGGNRFKKRIIICG